MRITILTCDKNSWVLPLTFHFLAKFWPDCPFPVDIVTGHGEIAQGLSEDREINVFRSDDAIWSDLLLDYLAPLADDEKRLFLLEDYLLADKINTAAIQICKALVEVKKAAFLRLNACPGPTLPFGVLRGSDLPEIGQFDQNAAYLTSTQPTIWRVGYLRRILLSGEDGWDFELRGTQRARFMNDLRLGVREGALMPIMNYLRRGQVDPNAQAEMEAKW